MDAFFTGVFKECRRGEKDTKKEIKPYLDKMWWLGTVDEYFEYWHRSEAILEFRLVDWIRKARQRGIICCMATNNDPYRTAFLRKDMHFDEIFDYGFYESELGCGKPSEEFYGHILWVLHTNHSIEPKETHMWDDREQYLDGAKKLGIQTHLYTGWEGSFFVPSSSREIA